MQDSLTISRPGIQLAFEKSRIMPKTTGQDVSRVFSRLRKRTMVLSSGAGVGAWGSNSPNAPYDGVVVPSWGQGFDLATDYALNLDYYAVQGLFPPGTDTHAATIYAPNAAGLYAPFAANVPVRTDLGLQTVPTRTNLLLQSQTFDNASWTKTRATVTANAATAPDGTNSADQIIEDASVTNSHYVLGTALTIAAATTYTLSVYAKAVGSRGVSLEVATTDFANGAFVKLNADGTVATSGVYGAGFTYVGYSVGTAVSSGFKLYELRFQGAVGSIYSFIYPTNGGLTSYTGDSASGLYVWQAQLEAGAFASPPIVTTTTAVTVNGDQQVIDLTGKLGGGVAGIIQIDFKDPGSNYISPFTLSDGTTANRVILVHDTGVFYFQVYVASVGTAFVVVPGGWPSGVQTLAFSAGPNYANCRRVGQSAATAGTSLTYPAMSRAEVGSNGAGLEQPYQRTRKLALKFGAQDATTFAAVYAKAVLAAAA